MKILKNYSRTIGWLLRDSLLRYKAATLVVLGAGLFGVSLQVASFLLPIQYGRILQAGQDLALGPFSLPVRDSYRTLVLVTAGMALGLLVSSLLLYLSNAKTIYLERDYRAFCSKRVVDLMIQNPVCRPMSAYPFFSSLDFQRMYLRDARYIAVVLKTVLSLIVPCFSVLVAFAGLMVIDAGLTLIVVAEVLVSMFVYYRISLWGAKQSREFEVEVQQIRGHMKPVLEGYLGHSETSAGDPDLDTMFDSGSMGGMLKHYANRHLALEYSRLATGAVFAVILGTIFLTLGFSILSSGTGWGRMILYISALIYGLKNFQGLIYKVVSVNRFYPYINRYRRYVESQLAGGEEPGELRDEELSVAEPSIAESGASVRLSAPSRVGLISPLRVDRINAEILVRAMGGRPAGHPVWVCGRIRVPLRMEPPTNIAALERFAAGRELLARDIDLTSPRAVQDAWLDLGYRLQCVYQLLPWLDRPAAWGFIDGELLNTFNEEEVRELLDALPTRVVAVVYLVKRVGRPDLLRFNGAPWLVVGEEGLIGTGSRDWVLEQAPSIEERLAGVAAARDAGSLDDEV